MRWHEHSLSFHLFDKIKPSNNNKGKTQHKRNPQRPEINKEFNARTENMGVDTVRIQGILLKYFCKNWSGTNGVQQITKTKLLHKNTSTTLGAQDSHLKTGTTSTEDKFTVKSHKVLEETNLYEKELMRKYKETTKLLNLK